HDRLYTALAAALARWGAPRTRAFVLEAAAGAAIAGARPFEWTRSLLRALDQSSLLSLCEALEATLGPARPAARSLRWDELIEMSRRGLTVASHTRTHALLARESAERVKE